MYCSIRISVFVFLPSLKCIPVFVFPNTFCLYLKCISGTYRDTLLQVYFSMIILVTIIMYPSISISKYIFEYFCPTLAATVDHGAVKRVGKSGIETSNFHEMWIKGYFIRFSLLSLGSCIFMFSNFRCLLSPLASHSHGVSAFCNA
uniref:Uncharacterized protein n=1 Tax=Ixodes ricinus TaxID=34613 RepID=A0A6B0UUF1_IXORI